jgi:hypothetical protein
MRIGILANILGNLHALEAVIKDCKEEKIEKFIILGNSIGYGPHDSKVLKLIHNLDVLYRLKGNQEKSLFSEESLNKLNVHLAQTIINSRETLDAEELTIIDHCLENCLYLKKFYFLPEVPIFPGRILSQCDSLRILLHKYPLYCIISSFYHQSFIANLNAKDELDITFKTPYSIPLESPVFFSIGSIGYPGGGSVTAKYGVLDITEGKITFKESTYDYTMTQRDMQVAGISKALIRQLSPLFNKNFEEEKTV